MAIPAPALTDEDIRQQVVNELKWDAEVEASEIGVAVREGLVTLTGWVDRFGKKWAPRSAGTATATERSRRSTGCRSPRPAGPGRRNRPPPIRSTRTT